MSDDNDTDIVFKDKVSGQDGEVKGAGADLAGFENDGAVGHLIQDALLVRPEDERHQSSVFIDYEEMVFDEGGVVGHVPLEDILIYC